MSVPVSEPTSAGVNVTLTLHLVPAFSVAPHVVEEMPKLLLAVMLLIFRLAVPVFFTVTVLAALVLLTASLPKLSEAGVIVAVGPCVTVSGSLVVCAKLPEVPVTITVAAPIVAVPLAAKVSVLALLAGFGLKAVVTPLGKPDAENDTLPLNPFHGVIVAVLVSCPPCGTLKLPGTASKFSPEAAALREEGGPRKQNESAA